MTKSEVIKIQRLLGLPQDGILGKKTAHTINLFMIKRRIRMKSIENIFDDDIRSHIILFLILLSSV